MSDRASVARPDGGGGRLGPRTQPRQSSIVIVTRAAEGHLKPLRHVLQTRLLEARKFKRGPLSFGQLGQTRSDHPLALLSSQALPVRPNGKFELFERSAAVGRSAAESLLAPQTSVISVLEQPYPDGTARRIVQMRLSIDLEKDLLSDVFSFGFVAKNIHRYSMDEPDVPMEQGAQGVAVRQVHFGDQIGVRFMTAGWVLASIDAVSHRRRITTYRCH
jgi:hypothetical protein